MEDFIYFSITATSTPPESKFPSKSQLQKSQAANAPQLHNLIQSP